MVKKKKYFLFLILLIIFISLTNCKLFQKLIKPDKKESISNTVKVSIFFDNSLKSKGAIKCGIAYKGGKNSLWVKNFFPEEIGFSDYTKKKVLYNIKNVPYGIWFIKCFVDLNKNGKIDKEEPFGQKKITINKRNNVYMAKVIISKYIVRNFNFSETGWIDKWKIYHSYSDVEEYVNKTKGDLLPEWNYYMGIKTANNKKPEILYNANMNTIRLITHKKINDGSNIWIEQEINYTLNFNSTFEIKFKINEYNGGDFVLPWYEAPVKIVLKINGVWFIAKGYTTKFADTNYGEGGLIRKHWYIKIEKLSGMELISDDTKENLYTISEGDTIESVRIKCDGWYWDIELDYFNIFEE